MTQLKFKKNKLPTDYKERLRYLYRVQELLRLHHNEVGKNFKTDSKIKKEQFRDFQRRWFMIRSSLICTEMGKCMRNLPKDFNPENYDDDDWENPYKVGKTDKTIIANLDDIE